GRVAETRGAEAVREEDHGPSARVPRGWGARAGVRRDSVLKAGGKAGRVDGRPGRDRIHVGCSRAVPGARRRVPELENHLARVARALGEDLFPLRNREIDGDRADGLPAGRRGKRQRGERARGPGNLRGPGRRSEGREREPPETARDDGPDHFFTPSLGACATSQASAWGRYFLRIRSVCANTARAWRARAIASVRSPPVAQRTRARVRRASAAFAERSSAGKTAFARRRGPIASAVRPSAKRMRPWLASAVAVQGCFGPTDFE